VVLTGIAFGALRDDLADRAALVALSRLSDEERRPERELWEAFARLHPRVLGALLTAASTALRRWEEARAGLSSLPRLADWAVWAEAAAPALGLEAGEVVAAFYEVQAAMEQDTLEADPVAQAILLLTRDWPEGHRREYPTAELLANLEQVMGLEEAKRKPEGWPRTPQGLGKHLPRLQAALRGAGIVIRGERDRRTKRHRWLLERVGGTIAANAANAAKPLQDGTPDCGYCPPSPPPIAAIAAQTPQEETPSGTASAAIAAIAAIDSPLLSKPGGGGTWEGEEEGEWL
jgi:hypothetical protein